ncbi:MAG: Lrp/AsnC family transcriptional regulator, partial [Deltaproteobacteria bacterium]
MKIDNTNLDIIKNLREGRRSFKDIADQLGLSENTVRARFHKLTEEGVLDITGLVDPEA